MHDKNPYCNSLYSGIDIFYSHGDVHLHTKTIFKQSFQDGIGNMHNRSSFENYIWEQWTDGRELKIAIIEKVFYIIISISLSHMVT